MKKSKLRKIIRESIKELLYEGKMDYSGIDGKSGATLIPPTRDQLNQSKNSVPGTPSADGDVATLNEGHMNPCPPNRRYIKLEACPNSYHWTGNSAAGSVWHAGCALIDGQTPNQSHVGTIIDYGPSNGSHGPNNYKVLEIVGAGYPAWGSSFHTTPYCCADPVQTGQGGCLSVGCPQCDPSGWSNYANWVSNWTSLPNFTSSNPNQPCNMICNKIQIWTNQCANSGNAGPNWQNQLACKIQEGQNQAQIHGCNC